MKPRILFVMHYLEIGGAETALIGLLQAMDYTKYDVDLFLHAHRGEMMQFVPKEVNLLPEIPIYAQIKRPMKNVLIDGYYRMVAARLLAKFKTKQYEKKKGIKETAAGLQYIDDAVIPLLPPINPDVEYDLAISFMQPHNVVRDKVRAQKKICWIHTDYSVVDVNAELEVSMWAAYDNVISISDDVTKTFLKIFPSLESKIVKIENILSPKYVRSRAEEFEVNYYNHELVSDSKIQVSRDDDVRCVNLLSIGRYCYQKNFENVPDICKRIISKLKIQGSRFNVRWFIIGYGGDEQLIRDKIAEDGMENHVILLGKKTNPYPYIKACDIYVQPSRYEGKSVTVREAQILYNPVVVTNYPTASSQIIDGKDGVIVPMENQGCAEGIVNLINDKTKQEDIINYLKTHDYGNEKEVVKLYQLINK